MKNPIPAFLVVLAASFAAAGCAQLDLTPESSPERVLNGTLNVRATLPAGAQLVVRVVETSNREMERPPNSDLPLVDRPRAPAVARVLGEQTMTLSAPTSEPVPFRIEYRAEESALRHGLNVEARISYDGKVRHRTVSAHVLTLASAPFSHELVMDPVR